MGARGAMRVCAADTYFPLSPTTVCHHRTAQAAYSILNNYVTIVKGVGTKPACDKIHFEIMNFFMIFRGTGLG